MNEAKIKEADLKEFFFTLSDVHKVEFGRGDGEVHDQPSYQQGQKHQPHPSVAEPVNILF